LCGVRKANYEILYSLLCHDPLPFIAYDRANADRQGALDAQCQTFGITAFRHSRISKPTGAAAMTSITELWKQTQELVRADDPAEIQRLEALTGTTQADAVNGFIEESCCSEDLPQWTGGKGTPAERLDALRTLWREYEGEAPE
jgi:hypothetical protein